jgi:hypothetical protein
LVSFCEMISQHTVNKKSVVDQVIFDYIIL